MASAPATQQSHERRLASQAARAVGVAVAVTMLIFATVVRLAPQVQRGQLLPFFEDYEVSRVRFFGMEFYADTSAGVADLLTVTALAGVACALCAVALVLARRGATQAGTLAVAAAGAAFLAADDLLGAHESVGHNLGFLAALPVVDHPDDVITGLYGLIVVTFAWRHRRLADKTPRWPWLAGAAAGAFAVAHDLLPLHLSRAEEAAEVIAGLALLVGVAFVAARQLEVPPAPESGLTLAPGPRPCEAAGTPALRPRNVLLGHRDRASTRSHR